MPKKMCCSNIVRTKGVEILGQKAAHSRKRSNNMCPLTGISSKGMSTGEGFGEIKGKRFHFWQRQKFR